MGGKHQGYLLLLRIGTNNAIIDINILIGFHFGLLHTIGLHTRQVISKAGCTIHGTFVGRIVTNSIVVDHAFRLETGIVFARLPWQSLEAYPNQIVENIAVYWSVYNTSGSVGNAVHHIRRVRLDRIIAITRKFHNHTRTPRITSEEPVKQGCFHLGVTFIACCFTIQSALGQHRGSQVVRTPDVRNTMQERTFYRLFISALDT